MNGNLFQENLKVCINFEFVNKIISEEIISEWSLTDGIKNKERNKETKSKNKIWCN